MLVQEEHGDFPGSMCYWRNQEIKFQKQLVSSLPGLSLKESSYNPATQDEFGRHFLFDALIGFCSSGVFVSSKFTDSGSLSLD